MATIAAAMVTTIETNWNVGLGGAKPTIAQLMDERGDLAPTIEQVIIRVPWIEDPVRFNDTYSHITYTLTIRIKTTTDEDRLKEIKDEVRRIIHTNAIGNIDKQFVGPGENKSDKSRKIFIHELRAVCVDYMATAGSSYSGTTTGDLTVAGDLTVNGNFGFNTGEDVDVILDEDDLASDDEDALATQQSIKAYADAILTSANPINIKPSGNIVDYLEFDTIGGHPIITAVGGGVLQIRGDSGPIRLQPSGDLSDYIEFSTTGNIPKIAAKGASDLQLATDTQTIGVDQIADLLMFGSANKTYVPCNIIISTGTDDYQIDASMISNAVVGAKWWYFDLPLPTTRGSLKLWIDSLEVGVFDADANNYVDEVEVWGIEFDGRTTLNPTGKTTNKTSQELVAYAITAHDCSGYSTLRVHVKSATDTEKALDLSHVSLRCYYAA